MNRPLRPAKIAPWSRSSTPGSPDADIRRRAVDAIQSTGPVPVPGKAPARADDGRWCVAKLAAIGDDAIPALIAAR